jgi:hypothetical protein
MKVYKIRNKKTGEFSSGGIWPIWHKTGKAYKTELAAKSIIKRTKKSVWNYKCKSFYSKNIVEIVEFTLVETKRITIK